MKSNVSLLIALLSMILSGCSQDKITELPLTMQTGYGSFDIGFGGIHPNSEDEDDPWKKTYLKISKFPEGLTDMRSGHIETNIYQSVYQNYLSGNITGEWYEELQRSWNWTPDTLSLSKTPVKTKIAFVYGKDTEGNLKMAVDANNNLDLSDDRLFTPLDMKSVGMNANKDLIHAIDVSFETFVHDQIVPAGVPLLVTYNSQIDMFMCNFSQHATTRYKGEQITVSSGFTDLSYENIEVALVHNDSAGIFNEEDIYRKNEYIEIKNEIHKILGVNTNKRTLVLEKTDLPKNQLVSTQIGYRAYPFQEKEFTGKSEISLEGFKGKYVLLDFWTTWCRPCIQEFPYLKELYAKTGRTKFEIVGIVGYSPSDAIVDAINTHGITWPQVFSDETNRIKEKYGISGYPATFLIDPEGVIVAKNLRGKELEEKILSLIKE